MYIIGGVIDKDQMTYLGVDFEGAPLRGCDLLEHSGQPGYFFRIPAWPGGEYNFKTDTRRGNPC